MTARVAIRTALIVALLAATVIPAAAQVPTLTEEVRWGEATVEQPPETDLSQRKVLAIPELPSAPTIDATLDDAAWEAAATTDEWMVSTGERPAPVQTKVWVGTRDGMFYVGFRAEEPNTEGIRATVTETDGPTWSDDAFEMFVDGNLDLETARQLVINPLGTVSTLQKQGDWDPDVNSAARIGDNAWMGEFAMPMSSLGITGAEFGINLCRERRALGDNQLSCWSPTGGGFHMPGKFGLGSLPGGWLKAFAVGKGVLGQNELTATLANPSDMDRSLKVRLAWWQGDGIALERTLGPFSVSAGGTREVTIGYDAHSAEEPVELELTVIGEDGETKAERQVSQEIMDVLAMAVNRRLLPEGERELMIRGTMRLSEAYLERSQVILAVFDREMILEARDVIKPQNRVMRAKLRVPPLETGPHTLHLVLKDGEGADAQRIAEEKVTLQMLPPVSAE